MSLQIRAFLLLLLVPAAVQTAVQADTTTKTLAPGVTLTQEIDKQTPLIVNVVSVDLTAPGVRIGVGIGQDQISGSDPAKGREDVSRLARRWGAVAAVNADFFPYTGDPLGVGIRNGELFSEPFLGIRGGGPRVTLGVSPDGKSVRFDALGFAGNLQAADGERSFIQGINRAAGANEVVVYTRLYGLQTGGKPGSIEAVVSGLGLPVRVNKLMAGRIQSVRRVESASEPIPENGVVLSAGPGTGAEWLAAHLHPGDPVSFVLAVAPVGQTAAAFRVAALPRTTRDAPSRAGAADRAAWIWGQVPQAVGGGPRLLVNGQVAVDWAAEGFDAGFAGSPNPRTAAGASRDGHRLYLVTVDGRQALSRGVSLTQMALILKRYGAWDAINLDGGGSTALVAGGLTVSSPGGDGAERPVADTLLVYSSRARQSSAPALPGLAGGEKGKEGSAARLVVPASPAAVGVPVRLGLEDGERAVSGSSESILWQGPAGGVGFVNQKGYLIPVKPGTGVVTALYKGQVLSAPISVAGPVAPAPVYTLQARLAPDPYGMADRNALVVRIVDTNGKPLGRQAVTLAVTGGVADSSVQTDLDGSATVGITWNAAVGGSVRVSAGALTPITLLRP